MEPIRRGRGRGKGSSGGRYGSKRDSYSYHKGYSTRGRYDRYSSRPYERDRESNYSTYRYCKASKRMPSRTTSPVEGSEEYMTRKIQATSAIIMRRLLSSDEVPNCDTKPSADAKKKPDSVSTVNTPKNNAKSRSKPEEKLVDKSKKCNGSSLTAKEIHDKIMNHIANLNEGKKRNFINSDKSTGWDDAISHMQKQKRLEISRILRDMNSSSDCQENGKCNDSVVPDIGIRINELPVDVIEELKRTLNLDLECLNEAIADSPSKENPPENISISSGELTAAVDSIQVKNEQNDYSFGSVEIKSEDISDIFEENVPAELVPSCLSAEVNSVQTKDQEDRQDSIHHEVDIKEEEVLSICTDSTVFLQNCASRDADTRQLNSGSNPGEVVTSATTHLTCESTLSYIESTIRTFVEKESNSECSQVDIALERIDLVDSCIKHLTNYRSSLTKSVIKSCRKNGESENIKGMDKDKSQGIETVNKKSFVARYSQTGLENEEDQQATKRQKVEVTMCNQKADLPLDNEIKTEETDALVETDTILNFPKVQERIMAIERVEKELLLATETGNIIFMNLTDGSISHCLDVTQCTITSLAFVKGINDFIYMYVGCLEEVLRVYDFRKRKMLRVSHIDDQIRCMDAMWDYVFMGGKNGALIRYSCKKEKIEFEEKNTSSDILVLKAAYEGPRRVLIVGHRQAPIYVRDAMSGLYLRNFSNQAVTPTVYSLVLDKNSLFCGTAKDNILVFSFQEGYLIGKITAQDSKGISCMKIYKNLLFAGCYNGSVYVYNLHRKDLVTILKGPGGSILCMEVLSNQIVVGTLTSYFHSIDLPKDIFRE